MTSESTRFFGQPRETKPILGLADWETGASSTPMASGWMEGGVTVL